MFFEYTRSTHIVVAPGMSRRLNHDAWQVVGSYFLTGEDASPNGVTPTHQLDPRSFGTGAIELVARFGELKVDRDTFAFGLADLNRSARKATNWSVGINWHLARNFKWMLDYERTSFNGGAPGGGDRQAEILILGRLQAAY
jgi:phosphate-selective porin OprO/OprP